MEFSAVVTLLSALGTLISAAVIAWQAILTRKAVSVSTSALKQSEREYRQRLIAALEAEMPTVRIRSNFDPDEQEFQILDPVETRRTSWKVDLAAEGANTPAPTRFTFPADSAKLLAAVVPIVLENRGSHAVSIDALDCWFSGGTLYSVGEHFVPSDGNAQIWVGGSETAETSLILYRSLQDLYKEREADTDGPTLSWFLYGKLRVRTEKDSAIEQYHHFALSLPDFIRDPSEPGYWYFEGRFSPTLLQTSGKKYFESRSEGIELRTSGAVSREDVLSLMGRGARESV